MKNILLICAMGMSTSLVVSKMEEAAKEKNIDVKIWAIGHAEVDAHYKNADIILVGPQIKYMKKNIESKVDGLKVEVIDNYDYAMANGASVLEKALKYIGE